METGRVSVPYGFIVTVDFVHLAALRVREAKETRLGKLLVEGLAHTHRDDVEAPGRRPQGAGVALGQEVGDDEERRAPPLDVGEVFERGAQICALSLWLGGKHLAHDPEDVDAPPAGRT